MPTRSLFWRYVRAPSLVGSVAPSSPVLARALSRQAGGYEHVLEFGAGTGPITKRLARDHGAANLTVFELDTAQARRLAARYPGAEVWDGCLHERTDVLMAAPARSIAVSSLPFRCLPEQVRAPTIDAIEAFLLAYPQRKLVQFTYGLKPPFDLRNASLAWKNLGRVWANLPPASVWSLARQEPLAF